MIVTSTSPGIAVATIKAIISLNIRAVAASAAKDRLKPTKFGLVVIPQQRKTFLHRAR